MVQRVMIQKMGWGHNSKVIEDFRHRIRNYGSGKAGWQSRITLRMR